MVVLPVEERELRVAARGRAAYRVRFYAVLGMLGLFIWCLKTSGLDPNSSEFGEEVTVYLLVPAFFFSLLIGVIATADCVSSEKREGTLGLLFLTDLKGYDVICGKLAANSLNAIYGLLAILPVLGLPVMLGGVTLAQFVKLAIVLLSTMVLSLSVGICVSTYSRNERKAMFFTVLILLAAGLLPVFLTAWYDNEVHSIPEKDVWLTAFFSPAYGVIQTMESSTMPEFSYWLCILWQWLAAAELIARASARVPHSWEESLKKPRLQFLKTTGRVKSRSAKGRAWMDRNPFLWLALQGDEASPRNVWLFVLAVFAIWAVAALTYGIGVATFAGTVTATIDALHVPLEIWIAAEASRRFSEDRSNHTLETLLSTPLNERQIIQGQLLALFKQFAGPIAAVLVWEAFMGILHKDEAYYVPWREDDTMAYWPEMVLLVANAAALAWAGMWLGLKCKGRIRAMLGSLTLVLFVPWVMTQLIDSLVLNLFRGRMSFGPLPWWETNWRLMAALLPSLVMDFLILIWATSRLPQNFRQLAVRR